VLSGPLQSAPRRERAAAEGTTRNSPARFNARRSAGPVRRLLRRAAAPRRFAEAAQFVRKLGVLDSSAL